jgi:acetyltransferase EpsM
LLTRHISKEIGVQDIIGLGGPGDGLIVAEVIRSAATSGAAVRCVGFQRDALPPGEMLHGCPILGNLETWADALTDCLFVPAIHKRKDMRRRPARIKALEIPREFWATVIHPTAFVPEMP